MEVDKEIEFLWGLAVRSGVWGLGMRSGLPDFALASLVEDQEVLILARDAVEKILLQDKYLKDSPSLKDELERRYQKLIGSEILT